MVAHYKSRSRDIGFATCMLLVLMFDSAEAAVSTHSLAFPTPSYVSTRVLFGRGATQALSDVIRPYGASRITVITCRLDPKRRWLTDILAMIDAHAVQVITNRVNNPNVQSITTIANSVREFGPDLIVAIGGGSVMDAAKVAAVMAMTTSELRVLLSSPESVTCSLPLIAVPTTSGTGSEVTGSATVWDEDTGLKHSLVGSAVYPKAAVVDPALTATIAPRIAASTGMDTLAHAIEASWSVKASAESLPYGLSAIDIVMANLAGRVARPDDPEKQDQLARASLLAGLAIAKATTTLGHAISYPLTARWGILHGHACAVSLPQLFRFNAAVGPEDCNDPRGSDYLFSVLGQMYAALGVEDAEEAALVLTDLLRDCSLETFDQLTGIDLPTIGRDVIGYDRFRNNPRRMTSLQLTALLHSMRN